VRIVSLLPSATEIVYALGLGEDVVGVTSECDFPPEATATPVVVRSALTPGRPPTPREIDDAVRERLDAHAPLYTLDRERIRQLEPDIVLTQDLCRVCAVPTGEVERALDELGASGARVVSLEPHSLGGILDAIADVGDALGVRDDAASLVASLRERIDRVRSTAARLPSVRVFCLEWLDPPFVAGHWVPEMVEAVGGSNLLNDRERPSRVATWREIRDANPEIVVFMPCGYYLEEAEDESATLLANAEFAETPAAREGTVFAADATSYFSRPGPRIVDGLEALAWAVHPDAFAEPPAGRISRVGR
jgi:iron complex transport system substrate-binding protein